MDPFPTALVKINIAAIILLITSVINHSIQAGFVPPDLKAAIIKPFLQKSTPDPELLAKYISNLPFLSKVLEKVDAAYLQDHLNYNLFENFRSGFRSAGCPSLLILFDMSAAFDTDDHGIFLNRLHHIIGLPDTALNRVRSYLIDGTE